MKRFAIDSLLVDAEKKIIYDGQTVVQVPPKVVEILVVLLEHAGDVVPRETLMEQVWGQTYVDESNLTRNVGVLRTILRTHLGGIDPIKTFPKRGYQFVGPAEAVETVAPMLVAQAERTEHGLVAAEQESPVRMDVLPMEPGQSEAAEAGETEAGRPAVAGSESVLASPESALASPEPVVAVRRRWGFRWVRSKVAIPLLVATGIAATAYVYGNGHRMGLRPSVAVLYLQDLSQDGEHAWIAEGMRETLSAGLGGDDAVRLIQPRRVTEAEQDLRIGAAREYDPATIHALGRILHCRYVVTGSYLETGDQIRFDLQMRDTDSGRVVTSTSSDTETPKLAEVAEQAVAKMRQALKQAPNPRISTYLLEDGASAVSGFADYLEGVHALETGQLNDARTLLSRAVIAHPSFPQAHSALGATWEAMGYAEQASAEARLALETDTTLPVAQRLAFQAESYRIGSDWPRAIDAYTQLAKQFPDDIDYPLALAECLTRAGHPDQAAQHLQALLKSSLEARNDPRVPMQQAAAAAAMGDWRGALLYSGQQIRLARASGSEFLLSRGLSTEGAVWIRLGNYDNAMTDYDAAQAIAEETDDTVELAGVLTARGAEKGLRKDPEAVPALTHAIQMYKDAGALAGEINALSELGCAYTYTEDWSAAKQAFHQAIDIAGQLHAPGLGIGAQMDLIYVALNEDQLQEAEQEAETGLQLANQIHNLDAVSTMELDLGDIHYAQGEIDRARKDYQQSMEVVRQIDGGYAIAKILSHMEVLETGAGNLEAAEKLDREATGMHVLLGERLEYEQVAKGALLIDEGRLAEARQAMTALAEQARTAHPGAEAWRLVALCDLKQGDLDGAQAAIDKALAFARGSKNTRTYLIPDSVMADRIAARRGRTAQALADLQQQLRRAAEIGDVPLQLSIRLAMGDVQMHAGQTAEARRTLQQVERQAAGDNLGLLVTKARRETTGLQRGV